MGDEADPADNVHVKALHDYAANEGGGAPVASVCAVLEEELIQMDDPAERAEFLADFGLEADEGGGGGAIGVVVRAAYKLLELQTFFSTYTSNPPAGCDS